MVVVDPGIYTESGKYLPNEAEVKLIDALRSGKYNQGTGHLRPVASEFCCLGVACDVIGGSDGWWDSAPYAWSYDHHQELMPPWVGHQLAWSMGSDGMLRFRDRDDRLIILSNLNDGGMMGKGRCTFDQIADIISHGLILKQGEKLPEDHDEYVQQEIVEPIDAD